MAATTMVTPLARLLAEGAAVAVDAGVLHDPAVGDDKPIAKIAIGPY